MILHRLASAICNQNWFQMIMEILIVVIGIFLGLQVDDWTEERESRAQERLYLESFHDETIVAIDRSSELLPRYQAGGDVLDGIIPIITGNEENVELTQLQCHLIYSSSIMVDPEFELPTIVELSSMGQLGIIQNRDIRNAMSDYNKAIVQWRSTITDLKRDTHFISSEYPELLEVDEFMPPTPLKREQFASLNHVCHLDLMKKNRSFRNKLSTNTVRFKSFTDDVLLEHEIQLRSLHNLLDSELGITH